MKPRDDKEPGSQADPASAERLARFGAVVRRMRREAGLSQEDLADAAHIDRTYVGSIERGERNISLLVLVRLATALGASVSRLTGGL